jgi:hypothetical protein
MKKFYNPSYVLDSLLPREAECGAMRGAIGERHVELTEGGP